MYIRPISDIHTEFTDMSTDIHELPHLDTDKESVLVIAGDLALGSRSLQFLYSVYDRFKHIVYVLGNHEYYHSDIDKVGHSLRTLLMFHGSNHKITVCEKGEVINIDGFPKIVAGTLWTNMDRSNPVAMDQLRRAMHDFTHIRKGDTLLRPEDYVSMFDETMKFFEQHVEEGSVVVTHHSPSFQCVHPEFKYSAFNDGFCSNLDDFIIRKKPKYWIHGHTHKGVDIKIGDTRVINNSRGYPTEANELYDETLVLEV